MSCQRRCDMFLATDGKWYMLLGNQEHDEEEEDCTAYGPFLSEEATQRYLHNNHSNPGGYCTDDSGTREPPAKVVHGARKSTNFRGIPGWR